MVDTLTCYTASRDDDVARDECDVVTTAGHGEAANSGKFAPSPRASAAAAEENPASCGMSHGIAPQLYDDDERRAMSRELLALQSQELRLLQQIQREELRAILHGGGGDCGGCGAAPRPPTRLDQRGLDVNFSLLAMAGIQDSADLSLPSSSGRLAGILDPAFSPATGGWGGGTMIPPAFSPAMGGWGGASNPSAAFGPAMSAGWGSLRRGGSGRSALGVAGMQCGSERRSPFSRFQLASHVAVPGVDFIGLRPSDSACSTETACEFELSQMGAMCAELGKEVRGGQAGECAGPESAAVSSAAASAEELRLENFGACESGGNSTSSGCSSHCSPSSSQSSWGQAAACDGEGERGGDEVVGVVSKSHEKKYDASVGCSVIKGDDMCRGRNGSKPGTAWWHIVGGCFNAPSVK
ncbi:hypothetical protein CLOM_g3658 [Closterium sp. NIES-68]|nr:hypothetical protein CLOM_g3658 [Closterium sp. NIES-68]GJP72002.1 hypothetical protein CLOP_g2779 [Closterium sp. NIES-67]GJP72215.1 hypothetical protein CLOP_g2965 [Closterium sp. NIES-67]